MGEISPVPATLITLSYGLAYCICMPLLFTRRPLSLMLTILKRCEKVTHSFVELEKDCVNFIRQM